jgi:hypothetical protein
MEAHTAALLSSTGGGVANGLLGEKGTTDTAIPIKPESMFDKIKSGFSTAFESLKGSLSTAWDSFSGLFKGMDFGKIFSDLGGLISKGVTTLFSFFFANGGLVKAFAEGGAVFGAGSATSDSIPAMLSNGEFVVNARAASKYMPLLESINNNKIPRFADGGAVGLSSMSKLSVAKPSNQQVINVNITGDISRQTRSEIYGMLPQIAAGVNSHNHERG